MYTRKHRGRLCVYSGWNSSRLMPTTASNITYVRTFVLGCVCVKIQGRWCLSNAWKGKIDTVPSQADARRCLRIIFSAKSTSHVTLLVASRPVDWRETSLRYDTLQYGETAATDGGLLSITLSVPFKLLKHHWHRYCCGFTLQWSFAFYAEWWKGWKIWLPATCQSIYNSRIGNQSILM